MELWELTTAEDKPGDEAYEYNDRNTIEPWFAVC